MDRARQRAAAQALTQPGTAAHCGRPWSVYRGAVIIRARLAVLLASLAALPSAAHAANADDESQPSRYAHAHQFGLRAALVGGYRMVLRYDSSPYCHAYMPDKSLDDQPTFCGVGAPLAIDLGLSAAVSDGFEPYLWARLGLASESASNTKPLVVLGLGTRLYTMSDSAFKIYLEPAVGMELEGQGDSPDRRLPPKDYKTDFLFHLAVGPQLDLAKNVGIYADAGLTVGVLRALSSTLELKAGVQARLP